MRLVNLQGQMCNSGLSAPMDYPMERCILNENTTSAAQVQRCFFSGGSPDVLTSSNLPATDLMDDLMEKSSVQPRVKRDLPRRLAQWRSSAPIKRFPDEENPSNDLTTSRTSAQHLQKRNVILIAVAAIGVVGLLMSMLFFLIYLLTPKPASRVKLDYFPPAYYAAYNPYYYGGYQRNIPVTSIYPEFEGTYDYQAAPWHTYTYYYNADGQKVSAVPQMSDVANRLDAPSVQVASGDEVGKDPTTLITNTNNTAAGIGFEDGKSVWPQRQ
jgi:hypothetical protein